VEDERGRLQVLKLITDVGNDGAALVEVLEQVRQSLPAHAGLLAITEVGISDEGVYLASPVLSAPSVEGRLHGGRQSLDATLSWLRGVVAGVQAAHDAGVWHGAIHPRDVLVGDEGGVLTGMGVAPALEHLKLQAPVRVPYTAPERASGRAWDARADQYSLAMLALDALSGRRLIAGTIPAFDRWTLAETPAEDARLHEVFVRALHPEPDQRYPSLEAWLEALAGASASAPGEEGALSRFAREGVILATAGAGVAEPGREIEVQELEVSESPLALFPEEDGPTVASPLPDGSTVVAASARGTAETDAEAEQEWLVAAVPDEPVEPTSAESPMIVPVPLAVAVAEAEASQAAGDQAETVPARWSLDDEDASTLVAPPRSWDAVPDEGPSRRPLVLALVALLIVALGYGTWRSLQAPTPVSTARDAGGAPADSDATGPADASGDDTAGVAATPPPTRRDPDADREGPDASRREPALVPQGPVDADTPRTAQAAPARPAATPDIRAAAAETPGEVAAATAGTGRALIRSSPSGDVQVNGRPRGETPVVLRDLPFGTYVVSISRPGFQTVQREVALLPSQPVASLTVDLVRSGSAPAEASARPVSQGGTLAPPTAATAPTGSTTPTSGPASQGPTTTIPPRPVPADGRTGWVFVVSTPAQARLYIDGQLYGSTPASIPGLAPGPHRVRVEARGFRTWEGQVQVQPGARVRVQATLQQEQE
jgi:hypothetical protein